VLRRTKRSWIMSAACLTAVLLNACGGSSGGGSNAGSLTNPSDVVTPTANATATIGPCQSSSTCNPAQFQLTVTVSAHSGSGVNGPPDGPFAYTMANQTVSGVGTQFTQFLLSQGNYEFSTVMSGPDITFNVISRGGAKLNSVHVVDGPPPDLSCTNGSNVLTFRRATGGSANVKFVIAIREGQTTCMTMARVLR